MDFLDDLLNNKKNKPEDGAKLTINHDKWDFSDWGKIITDMKELSNADDRLTDFTPTGHEAMTDVFFSLYKAMPKLRDQKDIRPSYLVNHRVMSETHELKEYEELRTYSTLDLVASGMAAVAIEPELEVIFDRLKDEVERSKQLEQMLQQLEGMGEEQQTLEQMLEEALEEGDSEGAQNFQDQIGLISESMENLRQQLEQGTQELNEALDGKSNTIAQGMKNAVDKAKEQAENVDSLSTSWGLDPGTIKKMSAEKRVELAKRINNEKFRKMADLIGPMQRLAMAEQHRKLEFAKDEIYDLELGSDIPHVLPEELLFFVTDETEMLFFKKFYEDNLMQFKLRGTEKIAKGNIIWCEDGSGSMSGAPEIWAKAVGLALLQIARHQNREFYGIHFCSTNIWKSWDFDHKAHKVEANDHRKNNQHFDELEGILDFAETFMGGGTDFVTPLALALTRLEKEFAATGKLSGDIVFCTDGMCGVPPAFLDRLAEAKERLGFRIFGILLGGGSVDSEPLKTICDGRVFTPKDMLNGKEISTIFRDV